MSTSNRRHRVAIVGSGFGGLAAAKALRRAPVDVTVIDRTNHHLFQPLLYQMAIGVVGAGDIAPPIRDSPGGDDQGVVADPSAPASRFERHAVLLRAR